MLPRKKLLLTVLAACLGFAALFAGDFVLINLGHAHPGEPCSVCLQLEAAHSLLEGPGRAGLFLFALCLVPQTAAVRNPSCFSGVPQTLVGLNIKNNS
jgi:hypothetical protein